VLHCTVLAVRKIVLCCHRVVYPWALATSVVARRLLGVRSVASGKCRWTPGAFTWCTEYGGPVGPQPSESVRGFRLKITHWLHGAAVPLN
jgi:hypothetical protein